MHWKRIASHEHDAHATKHTTHALEIPEAGCLVQVTAQRNGIGTGTALAISTVFVPGVKIVEVSPLEYELQSRWPWPENVADSVDEPASVEVKTLSPAEIPELQASDSASEPVSEPVRELVLIPDPEAPAPETVTESAPVIRKRK